MLDKIMNFRNNNKIRWIMMDSTKDQFLSAINLQDQKVQLEYNQML